MTTHLMLDLETLGTKPGVVVMSAALVRFNDEAHTTLNFSIEEQQAAGLEVDSNTLTWWNQQDRAAWAAATGNPVSLRDGLRHIVDWIAWAAGNTSDALIWCHGASFDAPILGAVFERFGCAVPWAFWNIRDTRTLYDLACINPKDYAVPPPHIALNDAIGQTRAANAALAILARAHQQPMRRYFYHPESGSAFHTDDGTHPADHGGVDSGHCEEITGGQYLHILSHQGVAA